jgi:hypothetical protein
MIGGAGRMARAAIAALAHMYSRHAIVQMVNSRSGVVSEVYDFRLNELRDDVHGSLKPQQITYGPRKKGRGGKIRRW